jgi:hypothetical protein
MVEERKNNQKDYYKAISSMAIKIGRIQTATANSPRFAKFIIKTPMGSQEIKRAVINEIIDLAYIERIQVTTDRILIERRGNEVIFRRID